MAYAVNVADTTNSAEQVRLITELLLRPVLGECNTVEAEPRNVAGTAVILDCTDERAEAIIAVIRTRFPNKHWFRFYRNQSSGWRRV